jgi:glycosyltransferase involved in cell wall biosynthesis
MPAFTVCMPSYNAATIIGATIESLLRQTFADWELLVVDDCSTDETEAVVRGFSDPRIRFSKNEQNLGYVGNFQKCCDLAQGTYAFFLANDDILSPLALERTHAAFVMAPDIAIVTRAYYWFENNDPDVPIRYTVPVDATCDRIVSINDDDRTLRTILDSLGQVSGLAFRTDVLKTTRNPHVWTAHIEPFLAAFKSYRAVFLHDYLLAVRVEFSQARHLPKIYKHAEQCFRGTTLCSSAQSRDREHHPSRGGASPAPLPFDHEMLLARSVALHRLSSYERAVDSLLVFRNRVPQLAATGFTAAGRPAQGSLHQSSARQHHAALSASISLNPA